MKHTNRKTLFLIRLLALSFAVFMASATPTFAASCAGISWATPGWPNISYPDYLFGAHERVRANYHSTLNCVGEATKNAITGTYYQKPTHQPNDQFYAAVETTPDVHGNPVFTTSAAQVMDSVNGGTSELLAAGSVGSPYNVVIVQDTLWFDHPGASAGDKKDIPFKLCYKYTTTTSDMTYAAYNDAITTQYTNKFSYQGSSAADTWSWDVSNVINHGNGTTVPWVWDQCNTGKYTMDGPGAGYYSYTTFDADGTQWYDSSKLQWQVDGKLLSCFQITPDPSTGHLPTDVTCHSASGTFPGCEFPIDENEVCGENRKKQGDQVAGCQESSCSCGNPANCAYGFKFQTENDYTGSGALALTRIYRSNGDWLNFNFGKYWRHNYDRSLQVVDGVTDGSDSALITTSEGTAYLFRTDAGDNNWQALDSDVKATFTQIYDSTPTLTGYLYTTESKTKEHYNTDKKLTRIEYQGGEALDLTYDTSDRLSTVTDEHGRTLTFSYDTSDRVSSVVTPDGTFSYSYDSNNNLTQVTKPDTNTRIYHYEDTTYVNALTGLTNEDSVRISTWSYDSEGRAVSSEHAGGVDNFTLTYNSDGTTTVTNPLGKDTTYTFTVVNGLRKVVQIDQAASTNTPAATMTYTYTSNGYIASKTDFEGNVTTYEYDENGLETSRTEAVGTSEERTITTTWDVTLRLPDVVTETGKTTDYGYDSDGRMTSVTVSDTNTSETRTTTYTYYSNSTGSGGQTILGRLKEIDGPRTDVTDKTTFTYDTSFRLIKTTDALGHYTETTSFDSADRPLITKDQNGVETVFTYNDEGQIETITVAPGTSLEAVTTLTYDDVGDIVEQELPNGVTVTYGYDNARRLTGITDSLGNTITYTLNDAGNVTKEEYKDNGASLKYTHSKTFDELSRLLTSIGADTQTWTYEYNKNSLQTKITDPKSSATDSAFDALNRLITRTDALSGVTTYTLNALDQTTEIEDPRSNATTYSYSAFGDVTQIISPDTGTTTFEYDKAGNMTKKTDARSVVVNFTYDAINRLSTVSYPSDSSLNVTLSYDDNPGTSGACGTSVGRLCRVVDPSGTTDYKYNDLGQLIEVKEVRGGLTFTTGYEYDLSSTLTKIMLPSGREIDYTLNANGQVTQIDTDVNSTATTIASSITYLPFGPMSGMSYGNSLALTAVYDQDYWPTSRSVNTVYSHTYDTDNNGNITQKGGRTYDYDDLNRLDEENDGSTTTTLTYDAIGNRLTETVGGSGTTYTYPSTSSKLSAVGSDSYTYDAAGNVTSNDVLDFTWDAAGRLDEAKSAGTSTVVGEYVYSYSGRRTSKTVSSVTTHYVYGQSGLLYGEYDSSGTMIREYIYVNGEPVAQIDAGSPETVIYLHTDHLMTPRYATNASASTVWIWDSGAFGKEAPSGTATVNLRFPGQYYDAETGKHYNWNRYYDPAIGRYDSSDPLGLIAENLRSPLFPPIIILLIDQRVPSDAKEVRVNELYAYGASNPLVRFDPYGLLSYNKSPPATVPVSKAVEYMVICIENCMSRKLVITGGAEQYGHSKGSKHYTGQAVDFGFSSNPGIKAQSTKFFCCAGNCGFLYGQTESNHYHIQTVPGRNGGHGEIKNTNMCVKCN